MSNRVSEIDAMNINSLAARPWIQPGYKYRPISIHDPAFAHFWSNYPYAGWVDVQVDNIKLAMFMANDDGVALIYNAFGPDSYEAASVAAWVAIARSCTQIADIGAFTGLYTLLAQKASPSAAVVSVEPNSASRARLFNNIVWNACDRSRVAPYAVAAEIGTLPLFVPMGADLLDTGSSLSKGDSVSRTEIVSCAPIDAIMDQFGLNSPDLMKIDVERLEVEALRGMPRSLSSHPTILLEIANVDLLEQCFAILAPRGYSMWGLRDDQITITDPVDGKNLREWFQSQGAPFLNYLCCARERHLSLAREGIERVSKLL